MILQWVGCSFESVACGRPGRRGRRHPPGAHAGAIGAARRLHCDARSGVAPRNSLRSLRLLRSNIRGESDHEARCARRPHSCASRRPTNRPRPMPPAARTPRWRAARTPRWQERGMCGGGLAIGRTRKPEAARHCHFPLYLALTGVATGGEPMPCPHRCALGSPQRALRGAEERRTRGRARSALRDPTRRGCLSAVSAANGASSATGHAAEYRRAVGAQRRPPR